MIVLAFLACGYAIGASLWIQDPIALTISILGTIGCTLITIDGYLKSR